MDECKPVSEAQFSYLKENYYQKVCKLNDGKPTELDRNKDSGSVWISKTDLESLFTDYTPSGNNEDVGVRLHFVVHDSTMDPPLSEEFSKYHNQLSVVLEVVGATSSTTKSSPTCICPPCRCLL